MKVVAEEVNLVPGHTDPVLYHLGDNGIFPNSRLPVLLYKNVLDLPMLFAAAKVKKLFRHNMWTNNWTDGIYTYHHYHSNTHEVLGIIKGKTELQLGGHDGINVLIEAGDVIVIPAGVAHKNLGRESDVSCVGGYPGGKDYDINYGKAGERPGTDKNIAALPLPKADPVLGYNRGLIKIWK